MTPRLTSPGRLALSTRRAAWAGPPGSAVATPPISFNGLRPTALTSTPKAEPWVEVPEPLAPVTARAYSRSSWERSTGSIFLPVATVQSYAAGATLVRITATWSAWSPRSDSNRRLAHYEQSWAMRCADLQRRWSAASAVRRMSRCTPEPVRCRFRSIDGRRPMRSTESVLGRRPLQCRSLDSCELVLAHLPTHPVVLID